MDETTNPFDVGPNWITKLDKGDFIGSETLTRLKAEGVQRRLAGFVMQERGVPPPTTGSCIKTILIGEVTSGTMSPTLGQAIGTATRASRLRQSWHGVRHRYSYKAVKAWVVPSPVRATPRQALMNVL